MICIFGEQNELMPAYVAWLAQKKSIDAVWLAESQLGEYWSYSFDDTSLFDGVLRVEGREYKFQDLKGAYVNLHPQPKIPYDIAIPQRERELFLDLRRHNIRYLIDMLPCRVANRLSAGRSNNSKPFQMHLLAKAQFLVPPWIASNDPSKVDHFAKQFSDNVIVKSCSGLRSRVRKLDESMLQHLSEGTTPTIVQQYIKGRDVRIHTVGTKCFATTVISDTIDYRFDEGEKQYATISVPESIKLLCSRFASGERLIIAGFDFKVTEDNKWYCLEMNPVPTFLPYEMETRQPIGATLLDYLLEG